MFQIRVMVYIMSRIVRFEGISTEPNQTAVYQVYWIPSVNKVTEQSLDTEKS